MKPRSQEVLTKYDLMGSPRPLGPAINSPAKPALQDPWLPMCLQTQPRLHLGSTTEPLRPEGWDGGTPGRPA